MPEEIHKLIIPHVENHERIFKAAMTCDRKLVAEAFLNDPQIKGRASEQELTKLANDMIDATMKYLPKGWK